MARVCHLITSLTTGGAETTLFRLLTAPDAARDGVAVICLTDLGTYGPRLRDAGIPVFTLDMTRGRFEMRAFFALVRHLRRLRPDILQTWLYHSDLLGLLAAGLARVPYTVWNIRCSVTDQRYVRGQAGVVLRLLAKLSPRPALVVSNSQAGITVHEALGYRPKQWMLIPNGIDVGTFRPDPDAYRDVRRELGLAADAILVGHVARFDPLKDHATFLRIAAIVARARSDVHFVGVGAGVHRSNPELAALADSLSIGSQLHLLDERRDIPRLNAAFDVALCTSTGEGFPNMIVEAMACAVPCVSTAVGDVPLLLRDAGLLAPVGAADALAAAVLRLVDGGVSCRQELGQAARNLIQRSYSLPTMVARYEALYNNLAAARGTIPAGTER